MLFCLFYLHFAYKIGSEHQLIVGSIRSYHRPIPYDDANKNLFCSEKNSGILHQKFGDVIIGEVRMVSPYKFSLGNKIVRSQLCSKRYDDTQKAQLRLLIDNDYHYNFEFDNISCISYENEQRKIGARIGFKKDNKYYLYTELNFLLHLSSLTGEAEVRGFDLLSLKEPVDIDSKDINFTYSILFDDLVDNTNARDKRYIESEVPKKSSLLVICSIVVSVLIIIFMVYFITKSENNTMDTDFDEYNGYEWKLIHGDVCRAPNKQSRLSALIGWGSQLALTFILVLIQGILDKIKLNVVSSLVKGFLVSFLISAPFGGFISGKLFKTIGSKGWKSMAFFSSLMLTSISSVLILILKIRLSLNSSSVMLPFKSILLFISCNFILYFIGTLIGLRGKGFELSQKVNQLPRQIPPQNTFFVVFINILGGCFIFISILLYCKVFFNLIWKFSNISFDIYHLLLNIILLFLQSATVGIISSYYLLNKEDYRWWWNSFKSGFFVGIFYIIYLIYYCINYYVPSDKDSLLIYIVVNMMGCFGLSIVCGTFSFIGSFFFIQKIYNSLKVE